MRLISGIILGIAATLGAAFLHDNNLPTTPRTLADRPIVNWDVLGAVANEQTARLRQLWDGIVGNDG